MILTILGVCSIINICKLIKKIPFISYIGRFSIITCGVHLPVAGKLYDHLIKICNEVLIGEMILFIIWILYSYLLTVIIIKYIPQFKYKKDLMI